MDVKAIFSNVNVFYMIAIILMIWGLIVFADDLTQSGVDWKRKFKCLTKDMYNCPGTAEYFSQFQSTYTTYPFGMIAGFATGIVTICILYAFTMVNKDMTIREAMGPLVAYCFFIAFATGYKIPNCMLGRMCGTEGCTTPYFNGSPNKPPACSPS